MDKRICVVCGEEFYPRRSNQITCSETCRKKRRYQACMESLARKRAGLPSINKKKYPEKVCVICGQVFFPNSAYAMTCGDEECWREHRRNVQRARRQRARRQKEEKRQNPQGLQELMKQLTAQGVQYAEHQKIETLAKIKNTGEV